MITTTMTLIAINGSASAVSANGTPLVMIQAKPLGADGLPSGSIVKLASSNTGVAKVSTAEQLGAAPAGVQGIAAGTATITATAQDGSNVTATLVVTVA